MMSSAKHDPVEEGRCITQRISSYVYKLLYCVIVLDVIDMRFMWTPHGAAS